jgi:hypothetical protein
MFFADGYSLMSRFLIHSIAFGDALNISSSSPLNFLMGLQLVDAKWSGMGSRIRSSRMALRSIYASGIHIYYILYECDLV